MKTTSKKPKRPARRKPATTSTQSLVLTPVVEGPIIELVPSMLKISRILVPVDFSDCSGKAMHYAMRFAEQFGAKVILAHVVELYPVDYMLGRKDAIDSKEWLLDQARARLEGMCREEDSSRRVSVERVVLFGKPYHQICEAAKNRHADLVIIATHGRTGLQRLQLGSTAERVVRHAPCPVLVVREREKEFA